MPYHHLRAHRDAPLRFQTMDTVGAIHESPAYTVSFRVERSGIEESTQYGGAKIPRLPLVARDDSKRTISTSSVTALPCHLPLKGKALARGRL